MIGKPNWFQRRKYGGWGIYPKTWQGWAYLAVAIALATAIQFLPLEETMRVYLTTALVLVMVIDVLDIMRGIKMDERERIHEAFAERNALWTIITVLAAGLVYQGITSSINGQTQIDPIIIIALLAGVITKAISNIYLDRKN